MKEGTEVPLATNVTDAHCDRRSPFKAHARCILYSQFITTTIISRTFFVYIQWFDWKRHLVLQTCKVNFNSCRMDYSCKTCSKTFTKRRNLTRQRSIHGGKRFLCDESLTRKDDLKRHQKQHQGTITNNCRKAFHHRVKLVEHQMHCQGNSLKRKRDEDDSGPATKKVRGENQVGEGKPDNYVKEENDNPCSSTAARFVKPEPDSEDVTTEAHLYENGTST